MPDTMKKNVYKEVDEFFRTDPAKEKEENAVQDKLKKIERDLPDRYKKALYGSNYVEEEE